MNTKLETQQQPIMCRCPVCGNAVPLETPIPRYDAPCSGCGSLVWCRQRSTGKTVLLDALPDRTPELQEVEVAVDALLGGGETSRIVLDMTRLELVSSAFVARLVSMNKRLRASGAELVLCGMSPVIREVFSQLHLDRAFRIVDSQNAV